MDAHTRGPATTGHEGTDAAAHRVWCRWAQRVVGTTALPTYTEGSDVEGVNIVCDGCGRVAFEPIQPDTSPDSEHARGMSPALARRLAEMVRPGAERCPHCDSPLEQTRNQMAGMGPAGRCPVSEELYHRRAVREPGPLPRAVRGYKLVADTDLPPSQREDDWTCGCARTTKNHQNAPTCGDCGQERTRTRCEYADAAEPSDRCDNCGTSHAEPECSRPLRINARGEVVKDDQPDDRCESCGARLGYNGHCDACRQYDRESGYKHGAHIRQPARYAFNTYLAGEHGHFKQALARALQLADNDNTARLAGHWPEMVAACRYQSWDREPLVVDVAKAYSQRQAPTRHYVDRSPQS